jgi:hypothetical protein
LTIFIAPVPGSFIEVRLPLFITELVLFFFFASSGERFASTGFAGEEPPGGGTRAGMA